MLRVTPADLRRLTPKGKPAILDGLAAAFDAAAAPFGILDRACRLQHFMAQAAHETDGFRTLEEYGGPEYWRRYDGRKDLGNVQPGDGARYHGRGIFQLTGRANYRRIGAALDLDLEGNPEQAALPDISLRIAIRYWTAAGLNRLADAGAIVDITRKINGGLNGYADRCRLLDIARGVWFS